MSCHGQPALVLAWLHSAVVAIDCSLILAVANGVVLKVKLFCSAQCFANFNLICNHLYRHDNLRHSNPPLRQPQTHLATSADLDSSS
ncbi:hypothetical protein TorRG33x02_233630 [Trema orientale]|uniref:Uncharacterized protein n=1 Tax=Trema orientale TaxID=63057 RepID=A0A2P5E5N2_TREOI|nr:hypothetical protein TorRG33x02_233630 [Trema orientale]